MSKIEIARSRSFRQSLCHFHLLSWLKRQARMTALLHTVGDRTRYSTQHRERPPPEGVIKMLSTVKQSPQKSSQDWQIKVQELVLAARKHPSGTAQRNYYLTQLIRLIEPRLWKFHTPYYADALQQTWIYFVNNVCTTYDPSRANVVTWLNSHLRFRHHDLVRKAWKSQQQEISLDAELSDQHGSTLNIGEIPTREYGSLSLLEEIIQHIQADVDGTLRRTCIKDHPEVNCQTLMLLRLPPETPWKEISAQFDIPVPSLSSFYQRKCIPYLQQLAQQMK